MSTPRIAIFYDWLNQWGGAEKVLLQLLQLYPQSELFTLVHDPHKTPWLPKNIKVHTSFLQNLPGAKNNAQLYTPIYDLALESFDFTNFDILISTTSTQGHCLITPPSCLHLCYYHNINRHLYNPKANILLKPLLHIYKHLDLYYSTRPDHSFCNSKTVQKRIKDTYHKKATIIHPGIDTNFFKARSNQDNLKAINALQEKYKIKLPSDYYLSVSRLVPHKKVDLTLKACLSLNKHLIIIGQGRERDYLKKLSSSSKIIIFLSSVNDSELLTLYQNAKALICPQLEDFGLTPIESLATGTPVIALNKGGYTETLNSKVALLFPQQTLNDLKSTILEFEQKIQQNYFKKELCRQQSLKFSEGKFMLHFNQALAKLWPTTQAK